MILEIKYSFLANYVWRPYCSFSFLRRGGNWLWLKTCHTFSLCNLLVEMFFWLIFCELVTCRYATWTKSKNSLSIVLAYIIKIIIIINNTNHKLFLKWYTPRCREFYPCFCQSNIIIMNNYRPTTFFFFESEGDHLASLPY